MLSIDPTFSMNIYLSVNVLKYKILAYQFKTIFKKHIFYRIHKNEMLLFK